MMGYPFVKPTLQHYMSSICTRPVGSNLRLFFPLRLPMRPFQLLSLFFITGALQNLSVSQEKKTEKKNHV